MKPYSYQQEAIDALIEKFKTNKRVCLQLSTGGGKTVIFAFFIKWYLSKFPYNVLILAHRTELIAQAEATLNEIGIGSEVVYSKTRRLRHHSRVYISMVETANNRLSRNHLFFQNVQMLIVDEAHVGVFDKVFDYFPTSRIMGCTATPCVLKRVTFWKCKYCRTSHPTPTMCCDEEVEEWSRPFTLSQIYNDIVIGPPIQKLFEYGAIVPEISFIKHYTDDTQLKTDSDGEFVPETVEKQYGSENAAFNVLLNYTELCEGKKTLIFNASTKSNPQLLHKFQEAGMGERVRLYDSVNKELSGSRAELLEWFANTPNAVLINTGVFTTGFDSKEVEAIIINRPTMSLSLFLQIVGRGGRSSSLIYKPNFVVVDGGGNIDRFGEWSSDRDWKDIFFRGLGGERAKRVNAVDVHTCPECGSLYPKSDTECPECGFIIPTPEPRSRPQKEGDEVLAPIRPIPPPNGEAIYKYTVKCGEDINFAFKLMVSQLVDMFRYYRITPRQYESSLASGELDKKTKRLIQKCYFVLLSKPDIQTTGRRTLAELLKRTKTQLEQYYENRGESYSTGSRNLVPKQLLPKTSFAEVCDI